jgi:proteasome lid subunit RPN8/RPN11
MWTIKKSVILNACESARNYFPNEFFCFLGGNPKKNVIDEIIFFPSDSTPVSASINPYIIPFDPSILGTLHSHPTGEANPSDADKDFFRKYGVNIILAWPYTIETMKVYNDKGQRIKVTIEED